ncbi:SusC/RagA family TonB-linked outer membrane protein [Anditalea andensis]|uniref:Membrane protein n=1 Tax=Anditalea andensis TaxID=1048983 RepID=A0A074L1P2_9BACT|nr:SusC/RagA family TonB-linked outer membrane protein [Anditalea andensis]KEO73783.1 membrane protein [Anditalea andensis]
MRYINIGVVMCIWVALFPPELFAQTEKEIDAHTLYISDNGAPVYKSGIPKGLQADKNKANSVKWLPSLGLSLSIDTTRVTDTVNQVGYVISPDQDGLVQMPFRRVSPQQSLGTVSHVNMPEILDKNYITHSLADMEAFVGGFNGNLWGFDEYLLLVDGVPRDVGSVMPTEIAQITFLKGVAAVVLYGSRAAKGVIMITTKRGEEGELRISVRTNAGIHAPRRFPKYLGSAEYMTLYNEARANDGLGQLYAQDDIYHHAAGTNPYRYPNVDFYSPEYLQKTYSRYDATVEIAGGNENAKYYTNIGYWNEGSLLDFGQAQHNMNERLNIRGNVDMRISKHISAFADAAIFFYNGKGVNTDYWANAATRRPHRFVPLIPISAIEEGDQASSNLVQNSDHIIEGRYILGGTQLEQNNPFADIYAGGSNQFTSRQFQFNTGVNADLDNVLEGLSFNSTFGVDYATSYNLSFNNDYAVYEATWNNYAGIDQISSLTRYGQDASTRTQNISDPWFRQTLSFNAQLNYLKQVNSRHNFSAMLIAGGFQQSISGIYHRVSNANLGLHLGYNFQEKYFAEFNGAVIHSARLPEHNRQAFSPTITLGWRISNEDFMASAAGVDYLNLSVSAGILHTDLDIEDYYLYESIYRQTDGAWYTWRDGLNNSSTDVRRGENPDMTFPKREELSVSLDGSFFNNLITFRGSAYINQMTGLLIQNTALYPNYFSTGWPTSSFIPYVNYNNDQRAGIDYNINLNKRIREVNWSLGLTGLYFTTKATRRAEIFQDGYQNREGRPLDALFGLQSDGFFKDMNDIESSPNQLFGEVRPGDIKYVDQNGDGIINAQDEVYLGRGGWYGAPLTGGVTLTANWKNFTFFALGVARMGGHAMRSGSYFWMSGEDKYSEVVRDRWTEETSDTATYPRLTTLNGNNNFRNSDFWLYSTNRFDLSRVQLSYNFPSNYLENTFVRELGAYINGANLLIVSPNREIMEMNVGGAPQTRFFNIGLRAMF